MRLINAQNLRPGKEPTETEERQRTFILDTAQDHGNSFFFSANVHQCYIFSVVAYKFVLLCFFLAGLGSG